MARLASRHCTTLKKGTKPIRDSLSQSLLNQLNPEWRMSKNKLAIERVFQFNNFQETVGFVNAVAWIANLENHHPELQIGHNRCEVSYSSHIADGLTVNDFICASKIDALFKGERFGKSDSETETKQARPAGASAENVEKALQFDAAEVDALLKPQVKAVTNTTSKVHDDEDEFELIDPDEIATVKQESPKPTAKTEQAKPQDSTRNLPNTEPSASASQPAQSADNQRNEPAKPQPHRPVDNQQKAPEPVKAQPPQPAHNQQSAKTPPLQTPASQQQKTVTRPDKPTSNNNRRSEPLSTSGTLIDPDIAHAADNFEMPEPVKPDIDLMSTVILPPGMQSIDYSVKAKDDEEDATVILSDTTATAEIDDKELDLKTASGTTDDEKQDTVIREQAPSDDDLDRTLILAPEQIAEITATVNTINNLKPEAKSTEENTEKTMVLTSDPTHAVRRLKEPVQPPANPNTDKNSEIQKTPPVTEENIEKTMSLSSETSKAGQPASTPSPTQGSKNTSKQSSEPGIEDDETLVMHSNTYKSIKHNPEK